MLSAVGFATNCVMVENYATQGGTEIVNDGAVTNKVPVLRPFSGTAASAVACATAGDAAINETCFTGTAASFFRDYAGGDYMPSPEGKLYDKGAELASVPAVDLAGNARVQSSRIDIGAYEAPPMFSLIMLR